MQEITVGQIIFTFKVLGIRIPIPVFLFNWTMEYVSPGNWLRTSKVLFDLLNSQTGNYTARRIIDGGGAKTADFPAWVASRDGQPFAYAEQIRP
jgi:hypothetical protein